MSDRAASWFALLICVIAIIIILLGPCADTAEAKGPHPRIDCSLEIRSTLPQCKKF